MRCVYVEIVLRRAESGALNAKANKVYALCTPAMRPCLRPRGYIKHRERLIEGRALGLKISHSVFLTKVKIRTVCIVGMHV